MIEHQVKRGRGLGQQSAASTILDFCFETAAAERALDSAIGKKQRFRASLLRTGAFDARNDAERKRLTLLQRVRQIIKKSRHKNFPFDRSTSSCFVTAGKVIMESCSIDTAGSLK